MIALIIDDSRAMRMMLSKFMTALDFDILVAGNGRAALDLLEAGCQPDLCLVDWNMPVMDGYTFVREVRRRPEWRDINLMMVTSERDQSHIVKALAVGAHEYVTKPVTFDDMLQKLELLGLVRGGALA